MAQASGSCSPSDFGVTVVTVYGTDAQYFYLPIFLMCAPEQWQIQSMTSPTRQHGILYSFMRESDADADWHIALFGIDSNRLEAVYYYDKLTDTVANPTWESEISIASRLSSNDSDMNAGPVACANEITTDTSKANWPRCLPTFTAVAEEPDSLGTPVIWGLYFEERHDDDYSDNAPYKTRMYSFLADADADASYDLVCSQACMSSLLIRYALANSLNKILYESRYTFSVPLFGYEEPS